MAFAQEDNSNILSITFELVESESIESWLFFIRNSQQHVTPQQDILAIYDRAGAIYATKKEEGSGWHPLGAYHAYYCIRHMVADFMSRFQCKKRKMSLINAVYSPNQEKHLAYMRALRDLKSKFSTWANMFRKEVWLRHYNSGPKVWPHDYQPI
ncbi:hypothetical protein AHAS_Ahas14G0162300 [Arachis hypogaea]